MATKVGALLEAMVMASKVGPLLHTTVVDAKAKAQRGMVITAKAMVMDAKTEPKRALL